MIKKWKNNGHEFTLIHTRKYKGNIKIFIDDNLLIDEKYYTRFNSQYYFKLDNQEYTVIIKSNFFGYNYDLKVNNHSISDIEGNKSILESEITKWNKMKAMGKSKFIYKHTKKMGIKGIAAGGILTLFELFFEFTLQNLIKRLTVYIIFFFIVGLIFGLFDSFSVWKDYKSNFDETAGIFKDITI